MALARGFLALGALVGEVRRLGGMMLALAAAAEGCRGVRCLAACVLLSLRARLKCGVLSLGPWVCGARLLS